MEYKLTERLRCNYNGRDFSGPAPEGMMLPSAIMLEAAAEIDRLTALCDGYRGEVEALRKDNGQLARGYTLTQNTYALALDDITALTIENERLHSALTRARAEGMEDAIPAAEDVPTTVSVYPTFEQARGATTAKEQIIAAIRERATKGDSE